MLWRGKESTEDDERRIDTSVSGLVRPWRLEDVRIALSRQFETKIALSPWSTSEQAKQADLFGSCGGMTVVGTHGIAVRYDSRRSPAHQCRQVCHEFGHLQAGHHLSLGDRPNLRNIPLELLSDLDIGKAGFVLSRDIFIAPEELDAERRGMVLAAGSTGGVEGGRWSIAGATFGD
ncbi:MAG: hypothetical protein WBB00_11775 [Mycobacterium sp.]